MGATAVISAYDSRVNNYNIFLVKSWYISQQTNSFYAISYYVEYIYRVKRKLDVKCYSYRML